MNNFWMNFAIEIGFLSLLGMAYYFYQKRKILKYEAQKPEQIMDQILQSCLNLRGETPHPKVDPMIEAIDDFLSKKTPHMPLSLLENYTLDSEADNELKKIILLGLKELKT